MQISEGYKSAHPLLVQAQLLTELDEVIMFKRSPHKQEVIKKMWADRLHGCGLPLASWERLLMVRSVVLLPQEMPETLLTFASLCRKEGRPWAAYQVLLLCLDLQLHSAE